MTVRRVIRILAALAVLALVFGAGYFWGFLKENSRINSINRGEYALEKTGISTEFAPAYSLYGYSGFRDWFGMTMMQIDRGDRDELLDAMDSLDGWHIGSATAEEFRRMPLWGYADVLQLSGDIVFDAWYYAETCEPPSYADRAPEGAFSEIGLVGHGFDLAVYDADTGLFIYIDQHG